MKIALVFLVCVYNVVEAQLNYAKQYHPQQVRYDDEVPTYSGIPYKSSISKEYLSNSYENAREAISSQQNLHTEGSPYPQPQHFHQTGSVPSNYRHPDESEKAAHYQLRNPSHDYPPVTYYRQPESHNNYHYQEHKPEPKEHQLNYQIEHHSPSHASVIHPQPTVPEPRQPNIPQPSHTALIYPQPAEPGHRQPDIPKPSHASLIYPQSAGPEHQKPEILTPSHSSLIYPQPPEAEHPTPKDVDHGPSQQLAPDYKQPANSQQPNSRVVRDPRLPLYFTMYEKRIITDPVDKYGKGPWRYLTYGHGITYGSKEPGKVFERGYGYIRALGREHCKLPENNCPKINSDKPFEYEGRKEPYFGYRPH